MSQRGDPPEFLHFASLLVGSIVLGQALDERHYYTAFGLGIVLGYQIWAAERRRRRV